MPIDLIMQIGTKRGHEERGNLGRFFDAPIDTCDHKSSQFHALDSYQRV